MFILTVMLLCFLSLYKLGAWIYSKMSEKQTIKKTYVMGHWTGGCLMQHDSIAESFNRSFLQYFNAALSSQMSFLSGLFICMIWSGFRDFTVHYSLRRRSLRFLSLYINLEDWYTRINHPKSKIIPTLPRCL